MAAYTFLLATLLWKGALVCAAVSDASSAPEGVSRDVEEPCGPPGAVRCDARARVLNVCGDDGAWTPVEDCAVHDRVCFDGRCLDVNLTRAGESCNHAQDTIDCSKDCSGVVVCSQYDIWTTILDCPSGKVCKESQCISPDSSFTCETLPESNIICLSQGTYPHIEYQGCLKYYSCEEKANGFITVYDKVCPGREYNACTGDCTNEFGGEECQEKYIECDGDYSTHAVDTNPSLYYVCAGRNVYWNRCPSGQYYAPSHGKCMDGFTGCGNGGNGGNGDGPCSCPSSPSNCQLSSGSTCSFCHCTDQKCETLDCNKDNYFNSTVGRCVSGKCQP